MSGVLKDRPHRGGLFPAVLVLAATAAGLGVPGLLSAAETITCDAQLMANPPANAQLGWAIAVDKIGNSTWLAAGASQDNAKGSVSMYLNPGPGTSQTEPKLIPADLQPGDQFGSSVSISGNWLAVGAPVGDGKVQDSGVVYLFNLDGSTWGQPIKLDATDAKKGARFGSSVSLGFSVALNGNVLVVGAPGESSRGSSAGAAYVFELGDTGWTQTAKLLVNNSQPFDEFGSSVATDGDEIVVGAPFADDPTVHKNFGAAYVFQRNANGWSLADKGKLTAGAFRPDNIQFGWSVAIGGGWIVVGARGDDQGVTDSGAAYVFDRNALGSPPSLLRADDPKQGAQFGTSLKIDGDILVGAPFDSNNVGAAYLFEKQTAAIWQPKFKFVHTPGGAFGQSVALLGSKVFMGGFEYNAGAEPHAGAVATCFGPPPQTCASSITKTDSQRTVQTGQTVIYQIDVKAALPGSTVSDPFPPGLEQVGWCRGKGCTNFVHKPLVDPLPAGGDVTYMVRGQVRNAATGEIKNEVCVDGDSCQETCASDTDQIQSPPVLSCVKTGPEVVNAGDTVTYTIVASNEEGGTAAHNVILKDPGSPGLQFLSASAPCGNGFPCDLGTIQPRQSLPPVTVTFQVPAECPAPSSVTNTADVVGSDAPEASCSVTTAVRVPPIADLGVSVNTPPTPSSPVSGGDGFELSATVTNAGPHTAQGTTADVFIGASAIIDSMPAGCSLVNPQPVASQPTHFICVLGDLPCGESKTLEFMVHAPACAGCTAGSSIDFTVEAKSQTPDPTTPDIATATVQVTCPPVLTITKTDSPDPVVPGQGLVYEITVKNTGASAVSGAVVEDDFPPELRKVRWCRGAGCVPSFSPPLKESVNLAAGETRIYRVSGIVQPMCSGVLHNKATITPPAGVCANQAIEDTQVVATGVHAFCEEISGPMLELTPITKTLLLINCGPANQADNPGDEFTDTLPAGLTLTGASATSGVASTSVNTAKWNGAIPAGGTVTITITANINAGTAGMTLCNQATIAYDADGDGTNESIGYSDDPDEPGPADPCCFQVITRIPALSWDGLAALALLLAGLAVLRLRRRPL